MSAVLVLCMVLPLAAGLCALFRCRLEEAIPLSLFALITVGYTLALAGLMWLAGPTLWLLNLAGGVWAVYVFGVKKALSPRGLWQGGLIFLLLALLFWWLCRGCALTDWDDFSHWGKAVKWMYYTDELYTVPASPDGFKSYPPATAILQYMFLKAGGFAFREDILLYSNAILTAGLLTLPFRGISLRRQPVQGIGLLVLLAVLPGSIYPSYFARASVDGLLGLFAGILILEGFLPGRSAASLWLEILGCFVLALVKSSGTGLAVMAALAIAFVHFRASSRPAAVLPLAAVAAAKLSWTIHLTRMGAGERWEWPGGLTGGIFSLITGRADAYRYTVLQNFLGTIFIRGNYGPGQSIPFVVIPTVFAAVAALTLVSHTKQQRSDARRKILPPAAAMLLITLVFVLTLLYSYLYLFNPAEAMYLASIYRYLDTCTMMLMTGAVVLPCVFAGEKSPWLRLLPAGTLLALMWLFPVGDFLAAVGQAPLRAAQSHNDRVLSSQAAQRIQALGEETPRLQLITADDAGSAALRIDYELLPARLPEQATILMADNKNEEPWVQEISAEAWSRELAQKYDYVYIYCPEDQFIADYGSVFEDDSQIGADRMFRVVVQPDGTARLRCMDEALQDTAPSD